VSIFGEAKGIIHVGAASNNEGIMGRKERMIHQGLITAVFKTIGLCNGLVAEHE